MNIPRQTHKEILYLIQRVLEFKGGFYIFHLNDEEKDYIFRLADNYADIFRLNSEKLRSNH